MMQTTYLRVNGEFQEVVFPDPAAEVVNGVPWGKVDEMLTPACWAFQCMAQMDSVDPHRFRMGETLEEEYATCLLAGYGVPAEVGMAASCRLRDHGVLDRSGDASEEHIMELLSKPLDVDGRQIRYRFYRTKARHLSVGLKALREERPSERDPVAFRAWFRKLPGVGPKTSSFITRNWLGSDDVAILDIHVIRACQAFGLFAPNADVTRTYIELEQKFVQFSRSLGVKASWLDAVMWDGMRMLSPKLIEEYAPVNSSPVMRESADLPASVVSIASTRVTGLEVSL
jgi:N-glycosylase/DNA lyase